MSYGWGAKTPNRPPTPPELRRPPLQLPDRTTVQYWINLTLWRALTVVTGTFTALSVLAGNGQGATTWAALFGLGVFAQAHTRLLRRVDRLENPRRIDLGTRPETPDRLLSRETRDTRLERPPAPPAEAPAMTPDVRCRMQR